MKKKMRTLIALTVALVLIMPMPSYSDDNKVTQDGYGLKKQAAAYDLVRAGNKHSNVNNAAMYHIGYISGAYDILINGRFICRVGEVTKGQIIEIVNDYVRSNPDKLNMHASELVYSALLPTFPCKK
jgi:hypothetical protein